MSSATQQVKKLVLYIFPPLSFKSIERDANNRVHDMPHTFKEKNTTSCTFQQTLRLGQSRHETVNLITVFGCLLINWLCSALMSVINHCGFKSVFVFSSVLF